MGRIFDFEIKLSMNESKKKAKKIVANLDVFTQSVLIPINLNLRLRECFCCSDIFDTS